MNTQNMTFEELKKLKKEKINELINQLKTDDNEVLWKFRAGTFTALLDNVFYKLLKLKDDEITRSQFDLLKKVNEFIAQRSKEKAIECTEKIKELEGNYMNNDKQLNEINNDNTSELITINKIEYENLKIYEKEFIDFEFSDFVLSITKGAVIPKENPHYNKNRINIKIFNQEKYSIFIDGNEYNIKSPQLFNKIKKIVSDNLNTLINWSIKQNKFNLDNNAYDGGIARSIKVKYGNLIINVNGQVSDIGNLCDEFIEEVKNLIINEGEKTHEDYMKEIIEKTEPLPPTPIDEEFEKYCKIYEDRFGKRAYIAESSGTREQTVNAIKICLEKNEDLLDSLLYPNSDEDINNGVLY